MCVPPGRREEGGGFEERDEGWIGGEEERGWTNGVVGEGVLPWAFLVWRMEGERVDESS